jgi:immune inhibitor A
MLFLSTLTSKQLDKFPPTVDFTYVCEELYCVFTNNSSDPDGRITNDVWDFGTGYTTNVVNPKYDYPDCGEYTVKLTVIDNDKNIITKTIVLSVSDNK